MSRSRWMTLLPCLSLLLPALSMASPRERFVLIVGNNASSTLGRPPLRFADDDAARYDAVFRLLAPEANVTVLTELDKDTARLFPDVQRRAEPPTRGRLRQAFEEISARAREASAQGRETELFFLFAGHGDVEQGKGFLELADGAFTSDELEEALSKVPVRRAHVVLDSCNSFFVLNPRKPGGRRYATPMDSARAMARRLPHVGVLLSTSAEAEVYEWSELQSGIFSHAVRSGLLGAADADGDGAITYEELAAFIETASRDVKNPSFRPHVFARGPAGDNQARLIELTSSAAVLSVDGSESVQLVVRDAEGLRWLDSHNEEGHGVRLSLPPATRGGSVERMLADGRSERFSLPEEGGPLASLSLVVGSPEPRGAAEPLRALFAQPFGPRALAAFHAEQAQAPLPVYGISRGDSERMGLLLEQLGQQQRQARHYGGAIGLAGGVAFGLAGALNLRADGYEAATWSYLAAGAFLAGAGTLKLLGTSEGEDVWADYRKGLLANEDPAHLVALTEERLQRIAESEKRRRFLVKLSGAFTFSVGTAFTVWQETSTPPLPESYGKSISRLVGPGLMLAGAGALLNAFLQSSPTEHLLEAWSTDPALRITTQLSITPLPKGGAMVSLSGQF